jgi:succinoglycan biosynthesis protein ExoA
VRGGADVGGDVRAGVRVRVGDGVGADVGVVVAARDAAGSLAEAVTAVVADAAAVVVAVDPADADTWAVAQALAADHPVVRAVANPGGRTAVGLNLAVGHLSAPVIARVDAHTVPPPGYLPAALATLQRTGAAVVGGRQVAVGERPVEVAVAAAMGTLAGSGGARHRVGTRPGPSETAYLGVFDRAWLDRVGGYDGTLDRNQDYEVCHRIRQAGGVVWFDPSLEVAYRPRGSWRALAAQYHDFGRFKRRVVVTAPGSVRLRQVLPAVLPLGLAWSAWLARGGRGRRGGGGGRGRGRVAAAVPSAWAAVLASAALTATAPEGAPPLRAADRARVALAVAVMHLAWGTGFWRGGR